MRILFLAPHPFFCMRGTSISARHIVTALAEAEHDVDLLCYPLGEDIQIPGVAIHRVRRPPGLRRIKPGPSLARIPLNIMMFVRAVRMCARGKYDVVHAVEETAFFSVWLKRLFGCKLIYDLHAGVSEPLPYGDATALRPSLRFRDVRERFAMRRADVVLTMCDTQSQEVRTRVGPTNVVQIEDAPIQASLHEDEEGAHRLREELGLAHGPAVVYTGSFEGYQGVDMLLRSARRVLQRCPDVRFVLVGGEEERVAEIRKLAQSLDIERACCFAGQRPPSEIPAFMTLAAVLVAPRLQGKHTAQKIYTYMQSGKPIVATKITPHTQVLDETCALLVVPQADDIADGIIRALQEPLLATPLVTEAKARVAARYSLASFKHKVRVAYQELASA